GRSLGGTSTRGAIAPRYVTTCINRQGPGGNSARVRIEKDNSHGQSDNPVLGRGPRGRGRRARIGRGGNAGGGAGRRRGPARRGQPAALGAGLLFVLGRRRGGRAQRGRRSRAAGRGRGRSAAAIRRRMIILPATIVRDQRNWA